MGSLRSHKPNLREKQQNRNLDSTASRDKTQREPARIDSVGKARTQLMGLFKCCRHKTDRHTSPVAVSLLSLWYHPQNRVIFPFVHPGPRRLLHKSNTGRLLRSATLSAPRVSLGFPRERCLSSPHFLSPSAIIIRGVVLKKFPSKRSLWKLGQVGNLVCDF